MSNISCAIFHAVTENDVVVTIYRIHTFKFCSMMIIIIVMALVVLNVATFCTHSPSHTHTLIDLCAEHNSSGEREKKRIVHTLWICW